MKRDSTILTLVAVAVIGTATLTLGARASQALPAPAEVALATPHVRSFAHLFPSGR